MFKRRIDRANNRQRRVMCVERARGQTLALFLGQHPFQLCIDGHPRIAVGRKEPLHYFAIAPAGIMRERLAFLSSQNTCGRCCQRV